MESHVQEVRMRKTLASLIVSAVLLLMTAGIAGAHSAPPCNDTDGDGSPSGAEYAAHHISVLAQDGALGNGGHKPGSHKGFSLCLAVH
jgi:hypothetical protein